MNLFCKQMGMELSNRCTNRRIILLRVHYAYSEYSEYSQYQRTECGQYVQYRQYKTLKYLKYREYPKYRTPKYFMSGSIRCTVPRNTASTRSIPQYTSPNYSEYNISQYFILLRVLAAFRSNMPEILRVHELPELFFLENT